MTQPNRHKLRRIPYLRPSFFRLRLRNKHAWLCACVRDACWLPPSACFTGACYVLHLRTTACCSGKHDDCRSVDHRITVIIRIRIQYYYCSSAASGDHVLCVLHTYNTCLLLVVCCCLLHSCMMHAELGTVAEVVTAQCRSRQPIPHLSKVPMFRQANTLHAASWTPIRTAITSTRIYEVVSLCVTGVTGWFLRNGHHRRFYKKSPMVYLPSTYQSSGLIATSRTCKGGRV